MHLADKKPLHIKILACILMVSGSRGGYDMARQTRYYGSREALETRVDYIESNLEKAIARLDEAIARSDARLDEAIARSDAKFDESRQEFKEAMQQMESRHKDSMVNLKEFVEKYEARTEAIAKDLRTSKNWTIATCIAVLTLVATIASGIIGQILTAIASSF